MLLFLAGLLACALASGAHFLGAGRAGSGPSLILLTPHGDNTRQEIGAAFQAWYLDHFGAQPDLVWVDQGGTSEDLRYVQARFAKNPESIGIDVFFGGGTAPFRALAKDDRLQASALRPEVLRTLPAEVGGIQVYSDREGWYGVALSGFGILYNKALLAAKGFPEPKSWADLARPELQGWIASVDPRGSGSAHVIYEIILQKYGWERGWEILMRMGANSRTFTRGASGALPLISTGEAAYTVAIDQYAWSLIEQVGGDKIGFVLPAGETVITPDPAGVFRGAPHPLVAARFLEFLVTPQCQRLWALKTGAPGGPARLSLNRLPVLPEVYSELDSNTSILRGNPFAEKARAWSYSDSLTESRWAFLNDALGLWMVDSHAAAAKAWEALRQGNSQVTLDSAAAADPLFEPPGTWDELRKQAARWKDGAFRNEVTTHWAIRLGRTAKERHD